MKIETVTGQMYEIAVDDSWTIRDLNEAIFDLAQIPADKQRLKFEGTQLCLSRSDAPLSAYGIGNDAKITLQGKLRGGGNKIIK